MERFEELRKLVADLNTIDKNRVRGELVVCALGGWGFLGIAATRESLPLSILFAVMSALFLYRGLSFLHELAHFEKRIPGFLFLFNFLLGFPNRVPAYSQMPHRFHHHIRTFSTDSDPEYERWGERSALYLLRPFFLSFFYPFFLVLRFGVWPLCLGLLPKRLERVTYEKASTFVMNLRYVRPYSEEDFSRMRREDLACALFFVAQVIAVSYGVLPERFFLFWYFEIAFISVLNTYRALVAHRYVTPANAEGSNSIDSQLEDSVTIEGGWWTELWAPIQLRYHSTHHLFPSIPFHSLKTAHQRLKAALPEDHPYRKTIEPGFPSAMRKLIRSAREHSRRQA